MGEGAQELMSPNSNSNLSFGDLLSGCTVDSPDPDDNWKFYTTGYVFNAKINVPAPQPSSEQHFAVGACTDQQKSKKRPSSSSSNREAVRRYREKMKAKVASVEEERDFLRAENQQLWERLQNQARLEVENLHFRFLLLNIRGIVDAGIGSLGSFPEMVMSPGTNWILQCNAQFDDHDQVFSGGG